MKKSEFIFFKNNSFICKVNKTDFSLVYLLNFIDFNRWDSN